MKNILTLALGATLAVGSALTLNGTLAGPAQAAAPAADQWSVGPVIRGRNYSVGMAPYLEQGRGGPSFAFPGPTRADGHVHAITLPAQSLAGARSITLKYRIDAAPGVRFYGQENGGPGWLSLFIQQRGDNWSAKGRYETYRWYSPNDRIATLKPGVHTVTVGLQEEWNAVIAWKRSENPAAFNTALANAGRVGFVFGSTSGLGHGVYATGPARFTILDFRVD